jgi:hypothetical protein
MLNKQTKRRTGILIVLAVILIGGTGCLTMNAIDNARNRAERARAEERAQEIKAQKERKEREEAQARSLPAAK